MDMIKYALAAVALAATAGIASAQEVTAQAEELGPSEDAVYSRQIQGANGVIYNCLPDPVMVDGKSALSCVRLNSTGAGAGLGGLGGGAAAGVGALVLVGLAAASDSSSSTTTTN